MNRLLTLWVLAGLFFSLAAVNTQAADSEVPTDFATIQAAIDDAGTVAGDTITVLGGVQAEPPIHITKSVSIQGSGMGITLIHTAGVGFFIDANDVSISDLTIEDGSQGIRFEMAGGTIDHTSLTRVELKNNSSRGIEIHNDTTVTDLSVNSCNFESTNIGFRVSSSGHLNDARFTNSTFKDLDIGLYEANDGGTSTMKDISVTGCTFQDITNGQGTAIFVEEIQDASISNNKFIDNRRDIQIFKWYQASVPVSNVSISNNTMMGTTNAVFAIFNAHHSSGQTVFDGVRFTDNIADTSNARGVYAGAHSSAGGDGGLGWDTVTIRCNQFNGITTPGNGVYFYDPVAVDDDTLGGAVLNVTQNWWGSDNLAVVEPLMTEPNITDFYPFLLIPNGCNFPRASTYAAEDMTCHSAVLRAGILTDGGLPTQYRFHYGIPGCPMQTTPWTDVTSSIVSATVSELLRNSEYEFKVEVKNAAGSYIAPGSRGFRTCAGDIIWVTEAIDRDVDTIQDDQAWVDLLTNAGYTVDVRPDFWTALEGIDANDTNDYIAELNATDLVIVSRAANSGNYDDGNEPTLWNSIASPMILMSTHIARSSRWLWFNTTDLLELLPAETEILDPGHPIFNGLANPVSVYDANVGTGLSNFLVTEDAGNGAVLATGDGLTQISEWSAGMEFYVDANQFAGGNRMFFVAGTQEVGGEQPQGALNLNADGQQLFLNAVDYMMPLVPVNPGTDNLVHQYTFEDGTADDSVGTAHGTLEGGASIVDGSLVTANQDEYLSLPGDVIDMNNFAEVTIAAWYTPQDGANTSWTMLAYFGGNENGVGGNGWFVTSARGDDVSRAAISVGNLTAPWEAESGANGPEYDDGLLHHMVGRISAADISLFIDGVLQARTLLSETNSLSGLSNSLAYLAKGGYDGDPEWIGAIHEFSIYNRALSDGEVLYLYSCK